MRARFYRTTLGAGVLVLASLLLAGSALAVTIVSFTPTSGLTQTPPDGSRCAGAVVAISGNGFVDEGGVKSVSFNGTASPYVMVGSNITVYAMVPDKATTGPITVTTTAGTTATSAQNFTVNTCPYTAPVAAPVASSAAAKPAISGFTPAKARAGAKLTITGTALLGATAVKIGGVKATFKVVSDTKITATVSAKSKSGKISVTTVAGTSTSSKSFTKA
jgi:hypothetical protein